MGKKDGNVEGVIPTNHIVENNNNKNTKMRVFFRLTFVNKYLPLLLIGGKGFRERQKFS